MRTAGPSDARKSLTAGPSEAVWRLQTLLVAAGVADKGVLQMSYRKGFILAVSLVALGAGSAHAQDDRYRKTNNDRYGDDDRYRDDRLYKDDGYYEDDDYYGDQGAYGNQGARGQGRATEARFRGMDRNRDGQISRDEWRGNEQSFRVHDSNDDGILTEREIRASFARRQNRNRNRNDDTRVDSLGTLDRNHDRNRDGVISRGEWSGSRDDFDWLDRNRDGYLTSSEANGRY